MARPKEFDEDVALDAAIQCFWSQGFEATSVRDLAQSMGITCASLYNAFGDKRALFRRALELYLERGMKGQIALHGQAASPMAAITGFLSDAVERSLADTQRRGCFLINSSLEMAPHDPEFRNIINAAFSEIEDFFRHCVEQGQECGQISPAQSARDVARMLLGLLMGIRVMARTRPERAALEGMVAPVFNILRP